MEEYEEQWKNMWKISTIDHSQNKFLPYFTYNSSDFYPRKMSDDVLLAGSHLVSAPWLNVNSFHSRKNFWPSPVHLLGFCRYFFGSILPLYIFFVMHLSLANRRGEQRTVAK
ncbi:hypothetical protein PoB_000121600 [Plakobranchus ocellatus]|uniref:Uncharacterized protein n=1 Tax=Plakobranchus ocellatus TaxID=259542 RepID=A0AAV3XXA7_9GAST|nr:hypothetical protein PoB_000121600 [Plakobranchus ocellatus]